MRDLALAARLDGSHPTEPGPHTIRYAVGDNRIDLTLDGGGTSSGMAQRFPGGASGVVDRLLGARMLGHLGRSGKSVYYQLTGAASSQRSQPDRVPVLRGAPSSSSQG